MLELGSDVQSGLTDIEIPRKITSCPNRHPDGNRILGLVSTVNMLRVCFDFRKTSFSPLFRVKTSDMQNRVIMRICATFSQKSRNIFVAKAADYNIL